MIVEVRQSDDVPAPQVPRWLDTDYAARVAVFAALAHLSVVLFLLN
jgi:hypothetical protein